MSMSRTGVAWRSCRWRSLLAIDRWSDAPGGPHGRRRTATCAGEAVHAAARPPDGQPDLQGFWTNSTYVPLERPARRDQGVLHAGGSAEPVEKRAAAREAEQTEPGTTADVHYDFTPVRARSQPVDVRPEPAHVADRRSARRQDSAGDRRRAEAGRRTRGRARKAHGRPVRRGAEHADRLALHHHGRRRSADDERRATTPTTRSCRRRAT